MCDTGAQLDAMYQGVIVDGLSGIAVLTVINSKAGHAACANIRHGAFMLVNIKLRIRRAHEGRTLYFYSGEVIAIRTPSGALKAIVPPITQHFSSYKPLDPRDVEEGA